MYLRWYFQFKVVLININKESITNIQNLKKIVQIVFSRRALTKNKIGLPNQNFHQFFCSKRLIHSIKRVKRCLCIEFEENRLRLFERITSGLTCGSPYPTSNFSIFAKTWKYYLYIYLILCITLGISLFISYGNVKS